MSNMMTIPREVIDVLVHNVNRQPTGSRNDNICVKAQYQGVEISIALDSSHMPRADLNRADIRVYSLRDKKEDLTKFVWPELARGDMSIVYGTIENLIETCRRIDNLNSLGVRQAGSHFRKG